jgi:hypothetical protein
MSRRSTAILPDKPVDTSAISIEQVDACFNYLHQSVRDLGGELAITGKFFDMVELAIESVKTTPD